MGARKSLFTARALVTLIRVMSLWPTVCRASNGSIISHSSHFFCLSHLPLPFLQFSVVTPPAKRHISFYPHTHRTRLVTAHIHLLKLASYRLICRHFALWDAVNVVWGTGFTVLPKCHKWQSHNHNTKWCEKINLFSCLFQSTNTPTHVCQEVKLSVHTNTSYHTLTYIYIYYVIV